MKKIKLMADYQCFPLWDASQEGGGRNINPDELPISLILKARLNLWALKYDGTLNQEYPPDSGFKNNEEENEFNVEGKSIFENLKKELGTSYVVIMQ
ncbi:hypothetical protein DAI18_07905 [Microvirgula aerodenitrificans]|uniref:Uncharacterized protein n=1 Tax=Microvirgula aerodenitrificans TaxID=57480 RepID=A0A2S0P9E2_9NEIS|nr:hypothetical protein [Microvirgula aerodenitrificans]AVY93976.1 hypothetical protein DAI18_07905 [Microvirgula aerodenitrificans]